MAATIGFLIAKVISIAGIGSFLCGFFMKSWRVLSIAIIAFALIDTIFLNIIGRPYLNFIGSLLFALIAATITGSISFTIGKVIRRKKDATL